MFLEKIECFFIVLYLICLAVFLLLFSRLNYRTIMLYLRWQFDESSVANYLRWNYFFVNQLIRMCIFSLPPLIGCVHKSVSRTMNSCEWWKLLNHSMRELESNEKCLLVCQIRSVLFWVFPIQYVVSSRTFNITG